MVQLAPAIIAAMLHCCRLLSQWCTAAVGMLVSAAGSAAIPGTQRVWFKTWGCAHNVSDSEYMMGQLAAYGYRLVGDEERDVADLWLLNSCTVKNPSQVRVGVWELSCPCRLAHNH